MTYNLGKGPFWHMQMKQGLLFYCMINYLTLKEPITTAADNSFSVFVCFLGGEGGSKKIDLDISCKLSAKQTIYIKWQDLFSLKSKTKLEC